MSTKQIGIYLGPVMFFLTLLFFNPPGLNDASRAVLASSLWIAIWWITEALPIAVTALLPMILFPLTGGMELADTTAAYGHKLVFLTLGGFIIAIAIEKWNLNKRIALHIISYIGTDLKMIILGFMVATAFLSMWISNTATSVMMLPIGIVIIKQIQDNSDFSGSASNTFAKALMLSIGYSASIGGVSTLIGTPTNMVLAGAISQIYDYEISFLEWFIFGFPLSIMILFFSWYYLTRIAFSFEQKRLPGGRAEILKLKKDLGKITFEQKAVSFVFFAAAFCWITKNFLLKNIFPRIDDTIISIFFATLLFLINVKGKKEKILKWEDTQRLPWGVLLLLGSGMSFAKAVDSSGLSVWVGTQISAFGTMNLFILLVLLITVVNFLTEIASNMATIAMMLPILAPIALEFDLHPFVLMVAAAAAASCAFMLPVATPPNAVVFGSGYLKINDMVKNGFLLNLTSIVIIALMVYFALPILWDLVPDEFPKSLNI
ncbi:MAG: DASS family sodium-coupled anion symporter [Flavobacteriaceae bacterium]|nr:DASS family sodium-coupled anion symporter [Flavobacteriaceae bacterium]MBL6692512.1 DASS family sodium-coupled anion symporter [Flavobacteriaceae bacterium]